MSAQPNTAQVTTSQVEAASRTLVPRAPFGPASAPALAGAARLRTYGNACGAASAAIPATRAMGLEAKRGMGWTTVHADFKASTTRRLERQLT